MYDGMHVPEISSYTKRCAPVFLFFFHFQQLSESMFINSTEYFNLFSQFPTDIQRLIFE